MTGWEYKREEKLVPAIRARLSAMLSQQGFRAKDIASALNVSQAAVSQYTRGVRGMESAELEDVQELLAPLAEEMARGIKAGGYTVETVKLVETAQQIIAFKRSRTVVSNAPESSKRHQSLETLRSRLQLELTAAEKYLELASDTRDDYTKMMLRMIASDSIKHADVVTQMISWLEAGEDVAFEAPHLALLGELLRIEDKASEANLAESVEVVHPVAHMLLQWIDIDEDKHEKIVSEILRLGNGTKPE